MLTLAVADGLAGRAGMTWGFLLGGSVDKFRAVD
jgi:hypothetical protein